MTSYVLLLFLGRTRLTRTSRCWRTCWSYGEKHILC